MSKIKLFSILIFFCAFCLFGFQASAFNVTYVNDSDILLTGPAITVTVLSGSKVDTVAVDANTITVTISNPDTFTIRSNNRYALANNAGIGVTCTADYSELAIPQQSGTRTVTVTLSTDTCSYPSVIIPATPVSTPTSSSTSTSVSPSTSAARTAELVKTAGNDKVYVVKNGKKIWIPNADAFNKAGYDWEKIKTITSSEAAKIAETNLIRAEGDAKVYRIADGKRTWIKTEEEFTAAGYKWNEIFDISSAELNVYPEGEVATVKVVSDIFSLNVRSDGSLSGKIISKLYPGNIVSRLGEKNGWYNVKLSDGTIGWVYSKYVVK